MADTYELALHGLLRKRGELTTEIEALRSQLGERLAALDDVDGAIRVFKPEIELGDVPERTSASLILSLA